MRLPHQINLIQEKRSITYTIVLGVWAIVFLYALIHDQLIVRIEPRHFTEFHEHVWGLDERHPKRLAAAWAL